MYGNSDELSSFKKGTATEIYDLDACMDNVSTMPTVKYQKKRPASSKPKKSHKSSSIDHDHENRQHMNMRGALSKKEMRQGRICYPANINRHTYVGVNEDEVRRVGEKGKLG